MAPGYFYWDITRVNFQTAVYANASYTSPTNVYRRQEPSYRRPEKPRIVPENKKQRIERIAKEKMLASWSIYHNKTMTVKEVVQTCKPKHKINHYGRSKS